MSGKFDYFVMLAEMRTGSNFLEENINAFDGLICYGEAYNPNFIGNPKRADLFGITKKDRDTDPFDLLHKMQAQTKGLPGFRFFHTHDQRMLEHFLPDPRCAKIILTRNPIDSYVSWKIARATDQWKLTNIKKRRSAAIAFDKAEFEKHLATLQKFQLQILNTLQISGQSAFYLSYEDIMDVDVLNGLAAFLGSDSRVKKLSTNLQRQNPGDLREKVTNYEEMIAALAGMDPFNLSRTPNFEPRKGPVVPSYIAAAKAPIMYLPIQGGPVAQVCGWLEALGNGGELLGGFNQKTLRQWKRKNAGHRSFTVIRHPLKRAHAMFCERILRTDAEAFSEIRAILRRDYDLPIPKGAIGDEYDLKSHHLAFLGFLGFLQKNLTDQTSVRVDPNWASQSNQLQGFGRFALPDMVLREDQLQNGLDQLCAQVEIKPHALPATDQGHPFSLDDIYDAQIEEAARKAYQRDYMMFGYKAYKP